MLRALTWLVIALVVVVAGFWLNFYMPSHDVVRITGTDTKRLDSSGFFDSEAPGLQAKNSRDVRFINSVYPDGRVQVFRNEDTDWSFPFYFKFDSGNLQAEAQSLISSADKPQWVVVTNYGWRVTYLTMFPNALAVRPAAGPDELVIPWFNIVVLGGGALLIGWFVYRIRRFKRERVDPAIEDLGGRLDDAVGTIASRGLQRARRGRQRK